MTLLFIMTMAVVALVVTIVGIPILPAAIIGGAAGLVVALVEHKANKS